MTLRSAELASPRPSSSRSKPPVEPAVAIDEPRSLNDALTQAGLKGGGAASKQDEEDLAPGTMITRYRILARLGAGGMGVVYRAHDVQLDREVALKVMRIGEGGTDGRARMLREARAAAKIRHPNVVTVFDADVVHERVFIAMELIDGVTLKAFFRGRARAWREVVAVLLGAGEGLAAAHAAGLVHRDFKPDNVLVEAGGRVRVLDFGLARTAYDVDGPTLKANQSAGSSASGENTPEEPPVLRTLTQTGTVVGTPAYMAPEQHRGLAVDSRSDQFSFCVTLFECLFKQRPFAGDTQSELTLNVVEGRLTLPADRGDVPQELVAALVRGLQVEPSARHSSLADLLQDLRTIVRKHEPRDRRGLLALVIAVAAGGAGVATLVGLSGSNDAPTEVHEPGPSKTIDAHTPIVEKQVTPPPVAHKPAQVTVVVPKESDRAAIVGLLGQILPEGTAAEAVPEGVALIGPKAATWRDGATALVLELGRRPGKPTGGVYTQVSTPLGLVAVYSIAAAELTARTQAIAKLEGITKAASSEALQVAIVVGTPAGLAAADKFVREAKAPKVREWCVRIHNEAGLGPEECHPTRAACEEDAQGWFGQGTKKNYCYGKK